MDAITEFNLTGMGARRWVSDGWAVGLVTARHGQDALVGLAGVSDAYELLRDMEARGVRPDMVSFTSLMDVVAKAAARGAATIHDADRVLQVRRGRGRGEEGRG